MCLVSLLRRSRHAGNLPAQVSTVPMRCPRCRYGNVDSGCGYPVGLIGMLRRRTTANYWAIWTLEMPLYLEDVEAWPERHRAVLVMAAAVVGTQPVNPAMAMELIRTLVAPLLSTEHAALLEVEGQPSWQRVYFLYPKLMFESRQGQDADAVSAATIIRILVRHTTRPPREPDFPSFVEIASFARVCGYLGLPVAAPVLEVAGSSLNLFAFCRYCWLPEVSRGVCQFHSTKTLPIAPPNGQPVCAIATLKQVQRLRENFEKRLQALATAEELAFHDSDFVAPILLPPSGLRGWLMQRRPHLAALVGPAATMPDMHALSDLLATLYGVRGPVVARGLGGAVHLLTPVTVRAEAWLSAQANRPRWGGARDRQNGAAR